VQIYYYALRTTWQRREGEQQQNKRSDPVLGGSLIIPRVAASSAGGQQMRGRHCHHLLVGEANGAAWAWAVLLPVGIRNLGGHCLLLGRSSSATRVSGSSSGKRRRKGSREEIRNEGKKRTISRATRDIKREEREEVEERFILNCGEWRRGGCHPQQSRRSEK
jgi:hypothetical protein